MDYLYGPSFFILGLAIGSFLNVCAYRIPKGESIIFPPSHCTECNHQIRAVDNIPVLSFILLGGRCRNCGSKISLRYPLVELITGVLWAASYFHFGLQLELAYALFFVTILVTVSAIDLETRLIPDRLLLPAILISLFYLALYLMKLDTIPIVNDLNKLWSIAGFFAGGGLLFLIALVAQPIFKKDVMGGGDIKLAAFTGLYLGEYVFLALFIGAFLGALTGVILIAANKKGMQDVIPFGPFIAMGSILTVFYGPQLWGSYLSLAGLS